MYVKHISNAKTLVQVSGNMVGKEYAIEMGIVDRLDDLIATEQTGEHSALLSRLIVLPIDTV